MRVEIIDGPPGVGKTTQICGLAPRLQGKTAIVTYTREAAATVLERAPGLEAGTIYRLTAPWTRPFWGGGPLMAASVKPPAHGSRKIRSEFDPALQTYRATARSRQPRRPSDEQAERLHAWDGEGAPPFDLAAASPSGGLRFILPVARWLAAPGRVPGPYENVIVDEAQDMSSLELAAALALLAPGGTLRCYGDPGQGIYMDSKGAAGQPLPPAWRLPGERLLLTGGHRVGQPAAAAAARVLRPIWDRPSSSFAAAHATELLLWHPGDPPPKYGFVLGCSRDCGTNFIMDHQLRDVALVPSVGQAKTDLVVSTIAGAKGAQASDVYLLPWTKKNLQRLNDGNPSSIRILYTGMTRAIRRLFLPSQLLAYVNAA